MKHRLLLFSVAAAIASHAAPVKIIFDTDMIGDYDDVGAMAVLHKLADADECEILATVSSTHSNASVGTVELLNAWYGRPDIPVGAVKGEGVGGGSEHPGHRSHAKYEWLLGRYPKLWRHRNANDAPDALDVYRGVLAAQPDGSVTICTVGYLTNLRILLQSKPDRHSPLDGRSLVARKVKAWYAMGWKIPEGRECNILNDPASARYVLENWPVPIVIDDFNYSQYIYAGRKVAAMPDDGNPVRDIFARCMTPAEKCPAAAEVIPTGRFRDNTKEGHNCFDQSCVLAAVRGPGSFFDLERGKMTMVGDKGDNVWTPDPAGPHSRMVDKWPRQKVAALVEELMAAPPRSRAAGGLSEAEVDRLCPPRAETAAEFKMGTYPPAARPYREAAMRVFAYMTSLPAMRTLVEKGEPEQTYQHNAYVSKTHAAHVSQMLEWSRRDPARREEAMRFAAASASYLLSQLEPQDAPLAWWPPTYGRTPLRRDPSDGGANRPAMVGNEPEGAVKYRGEVMLLYPADVGKAFVAYFRATGDRRFLDAARGIGETYLKTRRLDGSWPLKMRLATGEPIGENTLVPTRPMVFFRDLAEATGEKRWADVSDACFAWLEAHPLSDWNWDGQFEDIQPRPPYANPTKHNAVEAMFEILRRFPGDPARLEQCRRILRFCEKRFVCWERPANHPKWDVPSVLEQYSCFVPIDASVAKMIRAYLALWRATGDPVLLAKARALGDTITRVQTPEGRIPTFWTHDTLGQPLYDWLNCMGASASALLELDDAVGSAGASF